MLLAHAKAALEAVEFQTNYYYPLPKSQSCAGVLIFRESDYAFIFAFLTEHPTNEKPSTSIFDPVAGGFHWTCPVRLESCFQELKLTVEQVVEDWEIFNTHTGELPTNFKPLSIHDLNNRFSLDSLILDPLEKDLFPEQMPLKSVHLLKSIFFKDTYHGLWVLTRTNISTIYLIQLNYSKVSQTINPYSDIFTFNELALNYTEHVFDTDEWEELTLTQLLQLKNILLHLNSNPETEVPNTVFRILPSSEVRNWINPSNRYNFDLF